MTKPRLFSGMQPSADSLHAGNYIGALLQWKQLQTEYDALLARIAGDRSAEVERLAGLAAAARDHEGLIRMLEARQAPTGTYILDKDGLRPAKVMEPTP